MTAKAQRHSTGSVLLVRSPSCGAGLRAELEAMWFNEGNNLTATMFNFQVA